MRPGRLLLAGLAFALVLTGCSEPDVVADPPPLATPTAGSASPTSPSLTTTPPASATTTAPIASTSIPAAAQAHTAAGAEAFARYYVTLINAAWTLPSADLLGPYSQQSCKTCQNFQTASSRLVVQDQRYEAPPITVKSSVVVPGDTEERQVELRVTQEARRVIDSVGAVVRVTRKEQGVFQINVVWMPRDGWRVSKIFIQPAAPS